jgi:hypothetical protein
MRRHRLGNRMLSLGLVPKRIGGFLCLEKFAIVSHLPSLSKPRSLSHSSCSPPPPPGLPHGFHRRIRPVLRQARQGMLAHPRPAVRSATLCSPYARLSDRSPPAGVLAFVLVDRGLLSSARSRSGLVLCAPTVLICSGNTVFSVFRHLKDLVVILV